MKYATLRLSKKNDHGNYFDLKFKLLTNKFVPKWVNRVLEAQQNQYPISEPWAMYNLNSDMNDEFIKENINRLMKEVDQEHELFGIQIEDIKDQDLLNKIHAIFEETHGALDEWKTNPVFKNKSEMFRKNLSEINQLVHACESARGTPKIRIVWFDLPKTKLFNDDDYDLFTNKRTFGSLYHLYSDVGKNIEALTEDNDDHHHGVVPNLHYSADCVCYFRDNSEGEVMQMEREQKKYIERNGNYLKENGYAVDDKRLTTGRVEIARLETDLDNEELLEKMKNFNHIQSFFLS
jgi:hypothetical protein